MEIGKWIGIYWRRILEEIKTKDVLYTKGAVTTGFGGVDTRNYVAAAWPLYVEQYPVIHPDLKHYPVPIHFAQ